MRVPTTHGHSQGSVPKINAPLTAEGVNIPDGSAKVFRCWFKIALSCRIRCCPFAAAIICSSYQCIKVSTSLVVLLADSSVCLSLQAWPMFELLYLYIYIYIYIYAQIAQHSRMHQFTGWYSVVVDTDIDALVDRAAGIVI